jgi:endonuclease/exonuclease/phosphatase family metal-dependent hydrolase
MRRIIFVAITSFLWALCPVKAQTGNGALVIASYNLRYNNPDDGADAWPNRKDQVEALIRFYEFDLFGTQEGLIDQVKDLDAMKEYDYVGCGRDDGKEAGEHSAVFFRKDRFKVLDDGNFWLSQTPEKPSYGWGAACRRICSWAHFKDRKTGKDLFFFSVHFDHKSEEAREESGKLMVKKIEEIAGDSPVICVGDFNSTPDTKQIKTMKRFLQDSHDVSTMPPFGPEGTFNNFKLDAPMKSRIDYVFVSNNIEVEKYGVLTNHLYGHYPSDHLPVVTKIMMK